ncbi:MAG: hypothetical protein D6803_08415 [Anaerolineae bacterium]|nr:MAG: hypothetical protein D6803_08415 [Anaerolineae bacterium]
MKRPLGVFLLILGLLSGCNLPRRETPVFVPPSDYLATQPPLAALETAAAAQPTEIPPLSALETAAAPPTAMATPLPSPTATAMAITLPTPVPGAGNDGPLLYYTQAGDTLHALSVRFGVSPEEINTAGVLPEEGFINPNQLLIIPRRFTNTTAPVHLLPDSELVYSLSAAGFATENFVWEAGGYLRNYHEYLGMTGETYGGQIVREIALDNSINPRLLLALLEYQSGWVYGQPETLAAEDYPLEHVDLKDKGLLRQLKWAVNQLSIGYYGWREGRLTEITFRDGVTARLAPDLNAGTVALQYYFAQVYDSRGWLQAMNPETGFMALYVQMFGDPWERAKVVEPLFPPDLQQPELQLPFLPGRLWSFTGGPHGAWEKDGSWAAVDFAPAATESGCVESDAWATAVADGVVTRSERGILALDLDGDGFEQTGWVVVYLHLAEEGRAGVGRAVRAGDPIGHPSCEGGRATGTHIHLVRKYNGEWIAADGPIPFVLSGWRVVAGERQYAGWLVRGNEKVTANQYGSFESRIQLGQ